MTFSIEINRNKQSRIDEVDFSDLPFGKHYSDHMFIAEYREGKWGNCKIVPFGDLSLSPATSFIHYGQSVFEGMKAYKNDKGEPFLFRPDQNLKRFNLSASRMGMAEVPESLFMESLHELVYLERDWIPTMDGYSLYLRPFMFAADEFIGVRPTEQFNFMIIASPSGRYYPKPVKVIAAEKYVRAFPGGTGFAKAAGNYGGAMQPLIEAHDAGYDQVLWLDGFEFKYAEEIGTMNIFFIVDGVVITPALDGTILDGVTRDSAIKMLKSYGVKVEERKIALDEIAEASKKGLLQDAFGTGTAASIASISHIGYKGSVMELPSIESRALSNRLKNEMDAIKTGKLPDPYGWIVKVKSRITEIAH